MKFILKWRNTIFVVIVVLGIGMTTWLENGRVRVTSGQNMQLACMTPDGFDAIADAEHPINVNMIDQLIRAHGNEYRAYEYRQSENYARFKQEAVRQEMEYRIKLGHCTIVPEHTVVEVKHRDWSSAQSHKKDGTVKYALVPVSVAPPDKVGLEFFIQLQEWQQLDEQDRQNPKGPAGIGFEPGTPYSQVREDLRKLGFTSVITSSRRGGGCMSWDKRCLIAVEAEVCGVIGSAPCRFNWVREDQKLRVCTEGAPPVFQHFCD